MNKKPFWEESYEKQGAADTFADGKPSPEFFDLIKVLPKAARVLDLGCGDGRIALFLAENGFDVTAVDISKTAIDKLERLANERDLFVTTKVQDMQDYVFKNIHDLIVAHGCLHLIERDRWRNLIGQMKAHTCIGGYNVIAVFTDAIPSPPDLAEFTVGLFKEGELFEYYNDWRIVLQQSYVLEDKHPGGLKHRHPVNKIVAQRR